MVICTPCLYEMSSCSKSALSSCSKSDLYCSASGTPLAALEDSTLSKLSSSNEGLHLHLRLGDAATMAMTLMGASNSMDLNGVLTAESEKFRILPNNVMVPRISW